MRPDQLGGKDVIDTEARVLGDVCGIEFDTSTWAITHICINLSNRAIEALGYKKPRFLGKVVVDLPVSLINAVSDVVSLKKSLTEIQNLVDAHQ